MGFFSRLFASLFKPPPKPPVVTPTPTPVPPLPPPPVIPAPSPFNFVSQAGRAQAIRDLYVRKGAPSTKAPLASTIAAHQIIPFVGWVTNGETVSGNAKWFKTEDGNYFWSGNVEIVPAIPKYSPIAASQLLAIATTLTPARADEFTMHLNIAMREFAINTPLRQSAFLAQTMHESAEFSKLAEEFYYSSAARLVEIFRKYITLEMAPLYVGQPQKVANLVYANRMGNGDEASGDGWKYRGRGIIQITGKNNYRDCGLRMGLDLVSIPQFLEEPLHACRSAAWFWDSRLLNSLADKKDFIGITRIINGGITGLAERTVYYTKAKLALGIS